MSTKLLKIHLNINSMVSLLSIHIAAQGHFSHTVGNARGWTTGVSKRRGKARGVRRYRAHVSEMGRSPPLQTEANCSHPYSTPLDQPSPHPLRHPQPQSCGIVRAISRGKQISTIQYSVVLRLESHDTPLLSTAYVCRYKLDQQRANPALLPIICCFNTTEMNYIVGGLKPFSDISTKPNQLNCSIYLYRNYCIGLTVNYN